MGSAVPRNAQVLRHANMTALETVKRTHNTEPHACKNFRSMRNIVHTMQRLPEFDYVEPCICEICLERETASDPCRHTNHTWFAVFRLLPPICVARTRHSRTPSYKKTRLTNRWERTPASVSLYWSKCGQEQVWRPSPPTHSPTVVESLRLAGYYYLVLLTQLRRDDPRNKLVGTPPPRLYGLLRPRPLPHLFAQTASGVEL